MTYLEWLQHDCGYLSLRILPDGRWAAVMRLLFTGAVIVGRVGDFINVEDRWCYQNAQSAQAALDAWDGTGEPVGWHRNPKTGRRVSEHGEMEAYL